MLSVENWATRIASEVAPAEVELAPVWADAFVRGGKARKELFKHTNSQATGFTAGDYIVLTPMILQALAAAVPALLAILSTDVAGKFLECVKNAFALGEIFGKGKGLLGPEEAEKVSKESAAVSLAGDAVEVASNQAVYYAQLNDILKQLDRQLRPLNLGPEKQARVSLTVLRLLLENPPDATVFLKKLSEKK